MRMTWWAPLVVAMGLAGAGRAETPDGPEGDGLPPRLRAEILRRHQAEVRRTLAAARKAAPREDRPSRDSRRPRRVRDGEPPRDPAPEPR
jgi:hypothetical protein